MYLKYLLVTAACAAQVYANSKDYKYVAVFSIDGLHGSDVTKYVAKRPKSTIAELLENGYEYTNAYASSPSDSFPGTLNPFTGASPRTTGVWYDVTFDRTFYPPFSVSKTNCSGTSSGSVTGSAGAEVAYDESLDYDPTKLFSGGINPDNLPQAIVDNKCQKIYPHQRLRVNTVWELVQASGKQTAYTDKHPAYDLVRGPSGKGLSVGYFPEIAATDATSVDAIIAYDQLHVDAWLDWIKGTTPANSEVQEKLTGTPTLFGGNFQSVSVGQKTAGYEIKTLDFTANLLKALDFVDKSLGKIVDALQDKGIYDNTLIIIASKHGQAPIDRSKYAKIPPVSVTNATGVKVAYQTSDDIALIFLADHADTDTAVANLNKQRQALAISDIIYGPQLIARGFGDPTKDSAVPDIIVVPVEGVIYTKSTAKIAEHGGFNEDDRHVACFVSAKNLKKTKFPCPVSTRQVAPTILKALGLDVNKLQGAKAEGTQPLDGFTDS